ncbi:ABC transporter permease [Mucilaginibacter roseus]|uniref:ABC transporter permease n=1 Tax=Mucilaginibacter roseus TaxID=1528868 RepID=A0ABS8U6J0_9SPHI|nr:ABC transporter permease [Mucilaginibacter roseus]MCD8741770.1 ABC transporter permease [Mucilaginibacter roseus]
MITHYLKIAFRNMQKQKMYAAINIGGFAIGIAACILISLYIRNETSYDQDIANKDNVYRIVGELKVAGTTFRGISFQPPMAKALVNDFPEVKKAGRILHSKLFGGTENQIRRADQVNNTYEDGFCFADTSVIDILDIKMVYGNKLTALSNPNSVVINKSLADKYFPGQNPVGKTLIFNNNTKVPLTIGGVMRDFPENAHMQFKGFISLAGLKFWDGEQESWYASNYGIYVQMNPGVNVAAFNKKMTAGILDKYIIPTMKERGRSNVEEIRKNAKLSLQAVTDIHLNSYNIDENDIKHGDVRFIWLFAGIAGFILVLACINFLNLSTARSANRAREVGVRKVIGSTRANLIRQFLTESLLYSFFSFVLGLALTAIALPAFNKVAGTQLTLPWTEWWLLPVLVTSAFIIGLIAGIYPAFYLSYFKPATTLKGALSMGSRNSGLRSGLVIFQFTVSIVLIIGTAVIYKQMQYILNSKIGFDKEQVLTIEGADALGPQMASFKSELLNLPFVKNVTVSDFLPVSGTKRNGNSFFKEGREKEDPPIRTQHWVIDENYLATMGMKLIAGRNFRTDMPTDSQATIVNKAMISQLGYKNPLGKVITNGPEHLTIIGVIDNFNYESIKQQVDPMVMILGNSNSMVSVKVKSADMQAALAAINGTWKKFQPNQAMRYNFLDERYAAMYSDVQSTQYIFTGFSILAIVVACLGLFALAAFMAEQRSKEVSIRKVLGASVSNLFALLTGNFLKLVLISLVIAIPIGWLAMSKWLEDYVYRIKLSWDIFAVSGVIVIIIALVTVCWQAVSAALVNPIKNLRSE